MAGVGKLIREAQKLQKKMEMAQKELETREYTLQAAGGAVTVVINGQGLVRGLTLDAELLKEQKAFIEETLLVALQEAQTHARTQHEKCMQELAGPAAGLMGSMGLGNIL